MSEQRTYMGKFWEIDTCGETPEEYAEWYMKQNQKTELPTYYDTWVEYACCDAGFMVINDKLYKIDITSDIDNSDFCVIHKETDGSYSFATSFYDGGTYLEEMLSDEFERMKENGTF